MIVGEDDGHAHRVSLCPEQPEEGGGTPAVDRSGGKPNTPVTGGNKA
jgi:hypothetical protein